MDMDYLQRYLAQEEHTKWHGAASQALHFILGIDSSNWTYPPKDYVKPKAKHVNDPDGLLRSLNSSYSGPNTRGHIF